MSTLVSSAVGGAKKAAPKAVARRRPLPARASEPAEQSVSSLDAEGSPASGPSREPQTEAQTQEFTETASVVAPALRLVHVVSPPVDEPSQAPSRTEQQQPVGAQEVLDPEHSSITVASTATATTTTLFPSIGYDVAVPTPTSQSKRKQDQITPSDSTRPTKRPSTRSIGSGAHSPVLNAVAEQDTSVSSVPSTTSTNPSTTPAEQAPGEGGIAASVTSTVKESRTRQTRTAPGNRRGRKSRGQPSNGGTENIRQDGDVSAQEVLRNGQDSIQRSTTRRGRQKRRPPGVNAESQAVDGAENSAEPGENAQRESDNSQSDSESHQIDPKSLTMFDLSHDAKRGKVSEREKKMALIDWSEVARKRKEAMEAAIAARHTPAKNVRRSAERAISPDEPQQQAPDPSPAPAPSGDGDGGGGLQFRIVDGQIVVDEDTAMIDRQAQAEAEIQLSQPVEEETDLTTRINRTTWINDRRRDVADRVPFHKRKSDPWTVDETERLFQAISMFGTDYFTIAQMFPPKTRRQIKLKVLREEKLDPARVNAALLGQKVPMSLESYAEATGRDVSEFTRLGTLEEASAKIAEDMKDKEEAMRAAIAKEVEDEKQRDAFNRDLARMRTGKGGNAGERKSRKKAKGGGNLGGIPLDQEVEAGTVVG